MAAAALATPVRFPRMYMREAFADLRPDLPREAIERLVEQAIVAVETLGAEAQPPLGAGPLWPWPDPAPCKLPSDAFLP